MLPSAVRRIVACLAALAAVPLFSTASADDLTERVRPCTHCHGAEGRAAPDGYYPRLAGKPAEYLYRQLRHFRDGRRRYAPMTHLLDGLPDAYLAEMARHFAQLDLPYPAPRRAADPPAWLERGRQLAEQGDPAKRLPACRTCHGPAFTGVLPATPGLLGLPRDYLNAQLGAWKSRQRRAQSPDCMADIAARMTPEDIGAVAAWLSSRPLPQNSRPVAALDRKPDIDCGSFAARASAP